jgi:hypothetical protein
LVVPTIIVSGALANKYLNGGEAWVRLSWVLGLERLGCTVHFIEQIAPGQCVDANGIAVPFESCVNRAYFEAVTREFGIESATLVYGDGSETSGLALEELEQIADDADLLVNISGHLKLESLMSRLRRKAYVDLDPGFTQLWHAAGNTGAGLAGHDDFFTVGESIGTPTCRIPTGDIRWRPVRPPVVLDEWPRANGGAPNRFTTVASWRGAYGPIEYEGETLGLKVHEFRKVIGLPEQVELDFEIALDIHADDAKDLNALRDHGWRIVDPKTTVPDPGTFRRYVQGSGAEFSVAQAIYVKAGVGWFSDRTVRYLASGKPALIQDTGFTGNYPVTEGLLAFNTLEQAAEGARQISSSYDAHSQAAREIAERYFDSDQVLGRFLEEALE